jgi:hypothetical protein
MWKKGMNENQAISFIREKRGFIDPNIGFVGQLMELNKRFQEMRGLTPMTGNRYNRVQ